MRKNQVTVIVERFMDASPTGEHHVIDFYEDSNKIYKALFFAFYKALRGILKEERMKKKISKSK